MRSDDDELSRKNVCSLSTEQLEWVVQMLEPPPTTKQPFPTMSAVCL